MADKRWMPVSWEAESIAEVKAILNPVDKAHAIVAPDDGGGFDVWKFKNGDATADDGLNILSSTNPGVSGRWRRLGNVVNVKLFGAKGDGVTDDTAAIQTAIDTVESAGGGTVIVPEGTYLALSVSVGSNVRLVGEPGAIIQKNGGGPGTHVFDLDGESTSTFSLLTANGVIDDVTVSVTDGSLFAAGDYILISDLTYAYGTTGQTKEINQVDSVSGNTLTLKHRLIRAYATASSAEARTINPVNNTSFDRLELRNPAGTNNGGLISITLSTNIHLNRVRCFGSNDDPSFAVLSSRYVTLSFCEAHDGQNVSSGGYGYGVMFADSSHECACLDGIFSNIRENTFTDNTILSAFSRNVVNNAYDSGFNTHGTGCRHILVSENRFYSCRAIAIGVGSGAHSAGDLNISVIGNQIFAAGSSGISINSPSDGTKRNVGVVVAGNTIEGYGYVTGGAFGILLNYSDQLLVSGNTVRGVTTGAANGIGGNAYRYAEISNNYIYNLPNGRGISYQDGCDSIRIITNRLRDISSNNLFSFGTNTGVKVYLNEADDATNTFAATDDVWFANDASLLAWDYNAKTLGLGAAASATPGILLLAQKTINGSVGVKTRNAAGAGNTAAFAEFTVEVPTASGALAVFPDDYTNSYRQGFTSLLAKSDAVGAMVEAPTAGQIVKIVAGSGTTSAQFDASASAGFTRFLLHDVDSGLLQRVKVGANGSGPGGVGRALYIDNV